MQKFVIGCICVAFAAALCAIGSIFLIELITAESAGEAIGGIFLIPLGIICYVAQIAFTAAAEILLWNNFKKNGKCKTASAIIAIIIGVAILFSLSVFIVMLIR